MDSGNIWTSRDEGVVTQAERTRWVKEMEASKQHVCWGNTKLPGLTGLKCVWRGISSVQFSRSVVSDSLRPHKPQQPGLPIHHQLPECTQTHVHWVGDAIQPSHPLLPLLLLPSIFPASGCFQMTQLFTSGGQSIGVSASTSVLPMNTQDWSPVGWTSWISLQSKGLSRVFSNTTVQKHPFFGTQLSL